MLTLHFTLEAFLFTLQRQDMHFIIEGVVAQWCNPLTLKAEQSGGVGSRRGRASPLERHDKGVADSISA